VNTGLRAGLVSANGDVVLPLRYRAIQSFDAFGMAAASLPGKVERWGWVNRDGKEVIPCVWDRVDAFNRDGLARVQRAGQ